MSALLTGPDQRVAPHTGDRRQVVAVERWPELAWRAVAIILAAVAAAVGWPATVCAPLAALATVATVSALAVRRRRGWIDAVLVGVAGLLLTLVGLGLLLDRLPAGLTRTSWAIGAGALALVAVAWSWLRPVPRTPVPGVNGFVARGERLRLSASGWFWSSAAAALVVVAIAISVHAAQISDRPPLQLSVISSTGTGSGSAAVVEVTAGPKAGRYDLVVGSGAAASTVGTLSLHAGQTVRYRIPVSGGRAQVSLRAAGASADLRTVAVGAK